MDNLDTKLTDQFNSFDSKLNHLEVQIHSVDNEMTELKPQEIPKLMT